MSTVQEYFEDAPFAFHEIDTQGIIRRVNEKECKLLGYGREDLLGKYVWEFVVAEEREQSRLAVEEKLAGKRLLKPFLREYEIAGGSRLWMEIHECPILGADGSITGLRSFLIDVTEREVAGRNLRHSEMLRRQTEQIAKLSGWELDLLTKAETWSEEAYRLLGVSEDTPVNLARFLEHVHADDRTLLMVSIERAIRDRQPYDCEFRLQTPGGEMRVCRGCGKLVFDDGGRPIRLIGTTQDITEQKQIALEMQTLSNSLEAEREILKMLAAGTSLDQILDAINTNVDFLWPTAFCAIQLLDGSRRRFSETYVPGLPGAFADQLASWDVSPGNGSGAASAYFNRAVISEDIEHDPVWKNVKASAMAMGMKASWSFPIRDRKRKGLGTLTVFHRDIRQPSQVEHDTLAASAELAGLAVERRREESALWESKQRFETLTRNAPVGIFLTDPAGKCLFVNDSWLDISGQTAQQALGQGWLSILHPEDQEALSRDWSRAVTMARETTFEFRLSRRDQTEKWVTSRTLALRSEKGEITGFIGTVMDITDRKKVEEALAASERQLRLLVENLPAGAVFRKGETLVVNKAVEAMTGYHRQELATVDDWFGLLGGDGAGIARQHYEAARDAGFPEPRMTQVYRKDGQQRLFEIAAYISDEGEVWLIQDITQRKQMECDLRAERLRYELAVRGSLDGIWDWDIAGKSVYYSPRFLQLLGFEEREVLHPERFFWDRLHPDDALYVKRALRDHLSRHQPYDIECRLRLCSGEFGWFRTRGLAVWNSTGQATRMAGSISNVTLRKQAEEDLRNLVLQLKHAHRKAETAVRAKSEFLAHMSHEIRTPMHGVLGMTGLLLDTELNAEQREYAETVRNSAESLLTVLNDILDISKIEAGKMQIEAVGFDLEPTIAEVIQLLAPKAREKGIELITRFGRDVPERVTGDPARLRQIMLNLVGNAVKFTDSGFVSVAIEAATLVEPDTLSKDPCSGRIELCVAVRDSGIGIPRDKQRLLFDEFVQADASTTRRYGGTGLGLAICRRLLVLMGGSIQVESEAGKGTTFTFVLPMGACSPNSVHSAATNALSGRRCLAVSALAEMRDCLLGGLRNLGMEPEVIADGQAMLDRIRRPGQRRLPDAILLDQSSDVNPFDICRALQNYPEWRALPVIVVTSLRRGSDRAMFETAGVRALIGRPLRHRELLAALLQFLAGSQIAPDPATVVRPAGAAGAIGANVLVAEDNPINQRLAVRLLEKFGCRAMLAANGREAIEKWEKGDFDLILMDCHMPEMDGYEATMELRRRERNNGRERVPIVAMTANALEGDRERCLKVGMDDFLSKPVQVDLLQSTLQRWAECARSSQGGELSSVRK
ncbi:MAG: PAS domain S-box protein [Acidobacteria bacterium]|nr:PAS domain S-box protein [Acidobacteriota bacterium]